MANRRMFNKEIVSSDKFIDMPLSSQSLFFHLGMNADDDGFISSPKRIQRSIGCSEDDLKILIAKGFIYPFSSGVMVVLDWNKHNQIRKDRYTPTLHIMEKESLQLVDLKQCQPNGNQMATNGKPSIVKDSIVEYSIDIPQIEDLNTVCVDSGERSRLNVLEEQFEKFWEFYDYKKEKVKAKNNFLKLSDKQLKEISECLPNYIKNTNKDGTYPSRMYPSRYLNPKNELWKDEVVVPRATKEDDRWF